MRWLRLRMSETVWVEVGSRQWLSHRVRCRGKEERMALGPGVRRSPSGGSSRIARISASLRGSMRACGCLRARDWPNAAWCNPSTSPLGRGCKRLCHFPPQLFERFPARAYASCVQSGCCCMSQYQLMRSASEDVLMVSCFLEVSTNDLRLNLPPPRQIDSITIREFAHDVATSPDRRCG